MAAYTIAYWPATRAFYSTLSEAAAALETKLETLDSTTNTIYLIDIKNIGQGRAWEPILIYSG